MQTSRRQQDGICFLVKLEEYVNHLRYGATDSLEQVSWDRDKWIWDNWAGNMSLYTAPISSLKNRTQKWVSIFGTWLNQITSENNLWQHLELQRKFRW